MTKSNTIKIIILLGTLPTILILVILYNQSGFKIEMLPTITILILIYAIVVLKKEMI